MTQVHHDSESFVNISHCDTEDCFVLNLQYQSTMNQMINLIDLSESCSQEFAVRKRIQNNFILHHNMLSFFSV